LRHFGSVTGLRAASQAELQDVPGVGPTLAAAVHRALHPDTPSGAADLQG
jgi:excinuclease ABC subunit C